MNNKPVTPRPKLPHGRRVPLTLSLALEVHEFLTEFGRGNRSAAVDKLVALHLEREALRAEAAKREPRDELAAA